MLSYSYHIEFDAFFFCAAKYRPKRVLKYNMTCELSNTKKRLGVKKLPNPIESPCQDTKLGMNCENEQDNALQLTLSTP